MTNAQSRTALTMPQELIYRMFERQYNNVFIENSKIIFICNGIKIVIEVEQNCTMPRPIEMFDRVSMSHTTFYILFNVGEYEKDDVTIKSCLALYNGNLVIGDEDDFRSRTDQLHETIRVVLDASHRGRFDKLLYVQKLFYTED